MIEFNLYDKTHIQINNASRGYIRSVEDYISDYVKDYMFMPRYKKGGWDGKISLFKRGIRSFPYGLLLDVLRHHKIEFPEEPYEISNEVKSLFNGINPKDIKYNLLHKPYSYQQEVIEALLNKSKGIAVSATACHLKGDRVLMYDGTFKKIEYIKKDEIVIGGDGKPKKVLDVHHGIDDIYEIKPKNNRNPINVTKNHLLHLSFTNKGGRSKKHLTRENISVIDYLSKSKTYKHTSKLTYMDKDIDFIHIPTKCKLSPYFIGLYLGDGHNIQCAVSNIDKECIDAIYRESDKFGMNVRKKGDYTYIITGSKNRRNIIYNEFDKLGITFKPKNGVKCENRYIPQVVFHQSLDYRKEVLAGLIDSDGYLNKGIIYEYASKSKQLSSDVSRIAISLGLVCSISTKTINNINYYITNIMGNIDKIPVRIERKRDIRKKKVNSYKCGFDVKYKGRDEYYGIEVDDSLYITNDGMITHNSGKSLIIAYIIENISLMFQNKSLILVPTLQLVDQFKGDLIEYTMAEDRIGKVNSKYKEFDKEIVISTWQSMQNQLDKLDMFDTVIIDECVSGDTLILTHNGVVKIKDIDIGDIVISYNISTKEYENDLVENVFVNNPLTSNDDMYELLMENGDILQITGNHKVLTDMGYKKVKDLKKYDDILSYPI